MAICINCGKTFNNISRECPNCHTPISINNIVSAKEINDMKNDYDCKSNRLLILCAIIPVIGLIYYFYKRGEFPIKSSSALGGFLINTLLIVIIILMTLIINIL